jgi:hypothetical protein
VVKKVCYRVGITAFMNFFSRLANKIKRFGLPMSYSWVPISSYRHRVISGSCLSLKQTSAKPFNGAMMPLAFVPDWKKADYINQTSNARLRSRQSKWPHTNPLVSEHKTDFNSMFTYLDSLPWPLYGWRIVLQIQDLMMVSISVHRLVHLVFAIGHGKVVRTKMTQIINI